MTQIRTATHILIVLTERDWKYFKPGCLAFIAALKEEIPAKERDYNPLNREWTVAVKYADLIDTLKERHLVDHSQQGLF